MSGRETSGVDCIAGSTDLRRLRLRRTVREMTAQWWESAERARFEAEIERDPVAWAAHAAAIDPPDPSEYLDEADPR